MAGLLSFLAAGAAQGVGTGIVAEARAKREAAIAELENSRLMQREQASREFQQSERIAGQEFKSQEGALNRADTAEQRRLAAEEKAATSRAKAPDVSEFFDESGRAYKATWNPDTQSWDKVGGSKAPSNSNGVTIGPDGTVQIGGATLPAEMGARIGMGDAFLKELPGIREKIEDGAVSGPIERGQLAMGAGDPAVLWRRIETGRDALVRNLTGAGMSMSEAQNQADRYQITSTDSQATMLDKLKGLETDLIATRQGAIGAKTGSLSMEPPKTGGAKSEAAGTTEDKPATGSTTKRGVTWSLN